MSGWVDGAGGASTKLRQDGAYNLSKAMLTYLLDAVLHGHVDALQLLVCGVHARVDLVQQLILYIQFLQRV